MAGISFKAAGKLVNKNKFNAGNEIQSQEFFDVSGLEMYDFNARTYDQQIGRFMQIDPLTDDAYNSSPYVYANNNPILFYDPLGLSADSTNAPGFENSKGGAKKVLDEVVVTSSKKNTTVGEPGTLESFFPIWGSGRAAINDLQEGRWGWGIFNSVMAVSDVFLVKTLATAVGKALLKTAEKELLVDIAKLPVGRSGQPLKVVSKNIPTMINGRKFTGHALDQMQSRGIISPTAVIDAIENAARTRPGNRPGTIECYKENLKVIINKAGDVMTVMFQ
jgi:RHS repeat-associated protein